MSEEMKEVIISVTPEIGFDEGTGKSLPIKPTIAPTGSASPRITVDRPVPNYLRASNGSCHDFCKFGIKQDSEIKKTRPVFQRHLRNTQKPNEAHDQTDTRTHRHRRNKELLRTRQKKHEPTDEHKAIKQVDLPPEKIIQLSNSSTNITAASDQEPINLNDEMGDRLLPAYRDEESSEGSVSIKCMIPSYILEGHESGELESTNPSEEVFDESVSLSYDDKPMGNAIDVGGNLSLIQEEESSLETYESSAQKSIGSVECATDRVERSSDKTSIDGKLTTLEQSPKELSKTEGKINKHTASGKHKPSGYLGGARKLASQSKPKTPATRIRSPMYNASVSRAGGSFPEQTQMKKSSTGENSKRDASKLKNAQKTLGNVDRTQAPNAEQNDHFGVVTATKKKVRGTLDVAVKSKTGAELKKTFSIKKADASVKTLVRKKSILSAHKVMSPSVESTASMKLRKVVLKSSCSSASLGGLTDQRNRHKTTNVTGQSNAGGKEKASEVILTPTSSKPHFNRVSSLKLKKIKSVSPFMTIKNQTKFGRSGPKEKTSHATEPMTEKVDLNAIKQKLRKHVSHSSVRKEEHHGSTSRVNEVNECTPPREVNRRNSRDFSSELKLKQRRTASNQSVERLSRALNFSGGKVIKLQPENATPAWFRFRRNKSVAEKPSAKRVVGKTSYWKKVEQGDADSKNSSLEAPAIVLRHADVQDKKEVQGLFNNVIEETASKLVESRKSKVKALVGAFETVISLQESKTPVSVP